MKGGVGGSISGDEGTRGRPGVVSGSQLTCPPPSFPGPHPLPISPLQRYILAPADDAGGSGGANPNTVHAFTAKPLRPSHNFSHRHAKAFYPTGTQATAPILCWGWRGLHGHTGCSAASKCASSIIFTRRMFRLHLPRLCLVDAGEG